MIVKVVNIIFSIKTKRRVGYSYARTDVLSGVVVWAAKCVHFDFSFRAINLAFMFIYVVITCAQFHCLNDNKICLILFDLKSDGVV